MHVSLYSELPEVMARKGTRDGRARIVLGKRGSAGKSGMRLLNLNQVEGIMGVSRGNGCVCSTTLPWCE